MSFREAALEMKKHRLERMQKAMAEAEAHIADLERDLEYVVICGDCTHELGQNPGCARCFLFSAQPLGRVS